MNKASWLTIPLIISFLIGYFVLGKQKTWSFVGYQYKWSENYVDKNGFKSEADCLSFGETWLSKQARKEALYTCSYNCKPANIFPGSEVCNQVCEYGKQGFIQCRE